MSYESLAFVSGIVMLGISSLMQFLPNSSMPFNYGNSMMSDSFWSTTFAGSIIGCLSIPTIYLLGETLGMSSSLVAASSPLSFVLEKVGLISSDCEWSKSRKKFIKKGLYAMSVVAGSEIIVEKLD